MLVLTVAVAAFVIVHAEVTNYVPKDAISMFEMFQKYGLRGDDHQPVDEIKFVKYHPNYLEAIFNGQVVNLKSSPNANFKSTLILTSFVSAVGPNGPLYWEYPLLDENIFVKMAADRSPIGKEYYTVFHGDGYDFESLVLFDKKDMPKFVDPWTWNNTDATIGVWHEPFGTIVENATTHEISHFRSVYAVDSNGAEYYINSDNIIWGHITLTQGGEGVWMTNLTMTEKK
jgi:hypothetical protein